MTEFCDRPNRLKSKTRNTFSRNGCATKWNKIIQKSKQVSGKSKITGKGEKKVGSEILGRKNFGFH